MRGTLPLEERPARNHGLIRSWLAGRRLLQSFHGLQDGARILNIGCGGDSYHLRLLQRFGKTSWNLDAIDSDQPTAAAAHRAGLSVKHGDVREANLPPQSFDMILLFGTIEQVEDPVDLLMTVRDLLKPGGRAVIVTDNANTWNFRLFEQSDLGRSLFPRRWNLFHPFSLRRLAAITSFEVARIDTAASPVHWIYFLRNWLVERKSAPWLVDWLSSQVSVLGSGGVLRATFRKPR